MFPKLKHALELIDRVAGSGTTQDVEENGKQ